MLFELLSGQRPYQVENLPLPGVVRMIREHEPVRLGTLNTTFRGDTETIVAKAIEKEKTRRYASAGELAADIRRHLNNEPILARPIGHVERLGRWAKRNRSLAAAFAGLAVTLLAVTVGSLVAAGRFRDMAREQTALAASEGTQRRLAQEAEESARASLYAAEMSLAARVAELPTGLARLRELVAHWENLGEHSRDPRGWEWRLFRDLSRPERFIRTGRDFYAVAWSPDSARLAVTVDGAIELLDPVDGAVRSRFALDGGNAESLRWSTDGRRFAVGQHGGELGVYDAASGLAPYRATHGTASTTVCVHPAGNLVASHSDDGAVRVHDVAAGKVVAELGGALDQVPSEFAFSPDGRRLATYQTTGGSQPRRVVGIWDTADWKLLRTLDGPAGDWFTSIAWADDRRLLLTTERIGTVVLDAETNAAVWSLPADQHLMVSVDAALDGRLVAAGDWGRLVWVWDATTGKRLAVCRGHTERIFRVALAPDGSAVAAVARDGGNSALRVWELAGRRPVQTFEPPEPISVPVNGVVAWHPDGRHVAGWASGRSAIYDLDGKPAAFRRGYQFTWDRTGRRAVAQYTDDVLLYEADCEDPVQTLDLPGQIKSFAWSPTSDRLAIRIGLNLWLYDPAQLGPLVQLYDDSSLQGRFGYHRCGGVDWHPEGHLVAFAGQEPDGWSIRLIDPSTRTTESKFHAMPLTVWAVKWSPDASRIAVAGDDPAIKVFDSATGQLVQSLRGHTFTVRDLAYSPDGARLASAGLDGNILLWDTKSGRLILSFEMGSPALGVAWSPDGTKLATLTETGAIKIWDSGGDGSKP